MGAPPDWGDQVAHSGFVPCRLDALPACVLWQLSMVSPSSGALFLTWGAGLPFFPVSLIKLACASILRHFCGVPYPPAEAEPIDTLPPCPTCSASWSPHCSSSISAGILCLCVSVSVMRGWRAWGLAALPCFPGLLSTPSYSHTASRSHELRVFL